MKLQLARKKAGKTQERVAKEAGISVAQYQNVEYDKSTPNVRTAIRIADSLGVVDLRELFGGDTVEITGGPGHQSGLPGSPGRRRERRRVQ